MNNYFKWFGLPGSFVLTVLMSLFALALAFCFRTKDRWWCFAAMVMSSMGDILLMNFRNIGDHLPFPTFYTGACFFILAHLLYTGGYLSMIRENAYRYINPGFWTAVGFIVVAGVGLVILSLRDPSAKPSMYVICILYMLIIGTACATIFSYAWSVRSWRSIAAVGALSFVISDYIIGIGQLLGHWEFDHLIWWFYPIGQILILLPG